MARTTYPRTTRWEEIRKRIGDIECDRCGAEYKGYKALTKERLCTKCREGWNALDDNVPMWSYVND